MSPSPSSAFQSHTGITLEKALRVADDYAEARANYEAETDEVADPESGKKTEFIIRIAHSRFNRAALRIEDSLEIEKTRQRVSFHLYPDSYGTAGWYYATDAFIDKLQATIEEEVIRHGSVRHDTFLKTIDEAVLSHIIDPATEIRRCANCGNWFGSEYRGRARFCSGECRKRFSLLARAEGANTFICDAWNELHGEHSAPISEFSGMYHHDGDLHMTKFDELSLALVCAPCVAKKFPAWTSYVAPVLATAGKATA